MKSLFRNTMYTASAVLSSASAATAAGGREDSSGIFVWIFLAFCALIIVAQLIPSLLMMFGMVKGVAKKEEPAEETANKTH